MKEHKKMRNQIFICLCVTNFQPAITFKPALRIVNARDAESGEFPFAVRLEVHIKYYNLNATYLKVLHACSGAALTATWTLTAAHCVEKTGPYEPVTFDISDITVEMIWKIRYGTSKPSENNHIATVLECKRHLPTVPFRDSVTDYDIALLRTDPISVDTFARVSGVEYKALIGHEVTLIGFGWTAVGPNKYEFDTTYNLDKPLQVIDKALLMSCPSDKRFKFQYGTKICVASRCGTKQFLGIGDSGSPALHKTGIVGVLSTGTDIFLQANRPRYKPIARYASYAAVSLYIDWIYSTIANG